MRHPSLVRMRLGFVDPGTLAMVALLAVGAISLATTSRAVEEAVRFDVSSEEATEVTTPPPASLPSEPLLDGEPSPADEPPPEEKPNPQECRDARQQIRDQFRDLNRFEKMLRKLKLTSDLEKLVALRAKLKEFDRNIQDACTRDHLQGYWDEQTWEEINTFRCKAELPEQFVNIERDLKRLARQAPPKRLKLTGLDLDRFAANLGKVKQSFADAKAAVASGNCEDANEAMQPFWEEGMHPGEIMSVVNSLSELGRQLARVKDEKVKALFLEVLQPIIESANEGDFREANQALNEVFGELHQMLAKVLASRKYRGYERRLEKLEELLREKLGDDEGRDGSSGAGPSSPSGTSIVSGPFIGGWKVETVFGLDANGQWSENAIPPYRPTYVEFTSGGTNCVIDSADRMCTSYQQYEERDGTISFPGATSSRLTWRMVGEKLEIVHAGLVESAWVPNVKFISVKVR